MVHTARPQDPFKCTKCSASHVDIYDLEGKRYIACLDCGYEKEYSDENKNTK